MESMGPLMVIHFGDQEISDKLYNKWGGSRWIIEWWIYPVFNVDFIFHSGIGTQVDCIRVVLKAFMKFHT